MTYLTLFTTDTTGRTCIKRTETNTPVGRTLMDKAAFAALADANIVSARVDVTERSIAPKERTYR